MDEPQPQENLPPLRHDRSFWGMSITQFLGAFNDNLFKQLILLLGVPTAAAASGGQVDRQAEAMIVFAAAFLLFSGFAGYLSDRVSKRPVIILAKVAEIFVMGLGMLGFYYYEQIGFAGMLVVLFLMGTQSAFFGPAKYGILPESLRPNDLPRANGFFLMLTFLAIIFGTAIAGLLLDSLGTTQIWIGSMVCVAIAVVGTLTSLATRRVPVAQPGLKLRWSSWAMPPEIWHLLRRDRQLMLAILVVSIFWMVGGIVQQSVNALGKTQLGLDDWRTSLLAASIGVGIAFGCVLGGALSRGRVNKNVVTTGATGLIVSLVVLCLPGGEHRHLLGFAGSIPMLMVMGLFTGMFVVPIQVALQKRPPREEKGRMIATMNQFSWIGIILGALLFKACILLLDATGWPRNLLFGVAALLMVPVALFYRPTDEDFLEPS